MQVRYIDLRFNDMRNRFLLVLYMIVCRRNPQSAVAALIHCDFASEKVMEEIGESNQFMNLHDALEFYLQSGDGQANIWTKAAIQTNINQKK